MGNVRIINVPGIISQVFKPLSDTRIYDRMYLIASWNVIYWNEGTNAVAGTKVMRWKYVSCVPFAYPLPNTPWRMTVRKHFSHFSGMCYYQLLIKIAALWNIRSIKYSNLLLPKYLSSTLLYLFQYYSEINHDF